MGTDIVAPAAEFQAVYPNEASAEKLEALSLAIDQLNRTATLTILKIAARVDEIHGIFRYRRDEGGFAGYMERRHGYSSSAAYRFLDVHKRFGGESLPNWETLPRSAFYLMAPLSTPDEAIEEISRRVQTGEKLTLGEIKKIIEAKRTASVTVDNDDPAVSAAPEQDSPGNNGKASPKDPAVLAAANRAEARSRTEEKRRQQQVGAEIPNRIQADEIPTEANTTTDIEASAEERKARYATSDSDDLSGEGLKAEDYLEDDAARVIHEVHRCLTCFLPGGLNHFLETLSPEQKSAVGVLLGVRDAGKAVATLAALVKECLAHDFYEPHTESYSERLAEIKALIGRDGPAKNTEDVGSGDGELQELWGAATPDEQRAVLQHVGVGGILELLKDNRDLLAELYSRVIGLQVALASPVGVSKASKKLLGNLTGTLHWALGQNDPASGAQGLQIINGKLKANGRDPKDLCFAFAKKVKR